MASVPIPSDRPTLDKLVRLVRLRDLAKGIETGEKMSETLEEAYRALEDRNLEFIGAVHKAFVEKDMKFLKEYDSAVMLTTFVGGFLKWWEVSFTQRLEYAQKTIDLLREMRLDITEESTLVKKIREDNEAFLQNLAKAIEEVRVSKGKENEISNRMSLGSPIERSMDELDKVLDRRTRDAISLLSRTLTTAASQELYDLFTKEP